MILYKISKAYLIEIKIYRLNNDISKSKPLFIGRKGEIDQLFESLSSKRSITIIVGEEGIGKSALLDEFYTQ